MTDSELDSIRFRWSPKPLWVVWTEDGDLDGYLRADTREEAERVAREEHGEDYRVVRSDEVDRPQYAREDITALLAEVDRLRAEVDKKEGAE